MTSDSDDPLSRLFADHRTRKEQESQLAQQQAATHEAHKSNCRKSLRQRVVPLLTQFVSRIESEGHEAKVVERLEGSWTYPSVGIEFTPKSSVPGSNIVSPSQLTFMCAEGGFIEVKHEIRAGGRAHGPTGPGRSLAMDKITNEFVQEQVLSFIQQVLSLV